jgi:hypothetical protein
MMLELTLKLHYLKENQNEHYFWLPHFASLLVHKMKTLGPTY